MTVERTTSSRPWAHLVGDMRAYAVFTLDAGGVIDSWNAGVRELLGYEEHEFLGKSGSIIFTLEDRMAGVDQRELDTAREHGEAMDDRWHVRKNGTRLWANGIMHAVRGADGELVGYLKIMRDETQKRITEVRLRESDRRFTTAFKSNPSPVALVKRDDLRVLDINDAFSRTFGLHRRDVIGRTLADIEVEPPVEGFPGLREALSTEERLTVDAPFTRGDGSPGYATFVFEPITLAEEPHSMMLVYDVTEWRRAQNVLERRATEQSVFAELAASTLASRDVQPTLDLAARRVARTLRADHARVIEINEEGTHVRSSFAPTDPRSAQEPPVPRVREVDLGLVGVEVLTAEKLEPLGMSSGVRFPIHSHGGTFGFLEVFASRPDAFSQDDQAFLGGVTYLLAAAIEQQRLHDELERRAETDDLTGLLKRVPFEHRLVAALAQSQRHGTRVAVLFMDLDLFKDVNDSLGHEAGDTVLNQVAARIREAVRSWDVVARHGGDEFVLFLPDIKERSEIEHVTSRLLAAMRQPYDVEGQMLNVGATIGVAVYPDDGLDVKSLLGAADAALYRGKERGRDTFEFSSDEALP